MFCYQNIENLQLPVNDIFVRLPSDEHQIASPTEDRIAIGRAVAVEPVQVLVQDRRADFLEENFVPGSGRRIRKQQAIDDLGDDPVAD